MSENAIPKIEGHAAFYAHLRSGRVDKAQAIGLENDRFVEKILLGRKYNQAPIITSRICGLCPTIHNVTATRAIEDACGISVTPQTKKLRELMLCGQTIQSHALHLYLLVLPDYVGVSSSFELQKSHPDIFMNAINLKRYADLILEIVGGRAVHPISSVPGGFKSFPDLAKLKDLFKASDQSLEIAEKTVELFSNLEYPNLPQELFYNSLYTPKNYAFYDGEIHNTSGNQFQAQNYKQYIYEELKHYTRAKFGTIRGSEMMVGAVARMNINVNHLPDEVKNLRQKLGIKAKFDSAFDNTIAQALECYYFVIKSREILKHFQGNKIDVKEPVKPPRNFGIGTAACEAPRGTLIHHYELDENGDIENCDIITPTVLNLPAMELNMKNLGPLIADKDESEKTKIIEMLIRSFDPCITCATH